MNEVVIPWFPGCRHREDAFEWVLEHTPHPLRVGAGALPWRKADAVIPALEASDAEIVAVADADVWCDGLTEAFAAVDNGARWAIPHRRVKRLDEESTRRWRHGGTDFTFTQTPYLGMLGGGIVVAKREDLLAVPLDRRFVGWGQEDTAWGIALVTMLGAPWRGSADLFHLWHPPQERMTRRWGSLESKRLLKRYTAANGDPEAMRALLEEIHEPDHADQPTLHDHPSQ